MDFCKKAIIWDLDNTLYRITPEFADLLDETMAIALKEDFHLDKTVAELKAMVKDSFVQYRDGGQIFYDQYGVDPIKFFFAYHDRKPVEKIAPYAGLKERLEKLDLQQFIFTYSSNRTAQKILKQIGLEDMFQGRLYTVENYNFVKKNETVDVYLQICKDIGYLPEDCIFVDDSYSNLEFAKEAGMTTIRLYYRDNSAKDKPYIDAAYKGIFAFLDAYEQLCGQKV